MYYFMNFMNYYLVKFYKLQRLNQKCLWICSVLSQDFVTEPGVRISFHFNIEKSIQRVFNIVSFMKKSWIPGWRFEYSGLKEWKYLLDIQV